MNLPTEWIDEMKKLILTKNEYLVYEYGGCYERKRELLSDRPG